MTLISRQIKKGVGVISYPLTTLTITKLLLNIYNGLSQENKTIIP
jgi:hypothetical protein